MFVKSNMAKEVKYNKSKGSIVLKPNTVTYVDDNLVSAKELKDCYGDRISIMSRSLVERIIVETAPKDVDNLIDTVKEEKVEPVEETGKDETSEEIEQKTMNEENENHEEEQDGSEEDNSEEDDLISNTGDDEIDSFLNGETDKVPEGTIEISENEALKLKEEADKKEEKKAVKKGVRKASKGAKNK